ncbi:MAG: hypothetical protein M1821_010064 [Bathelium mastoideum]|nr:MAG: hypothetical protein M1821_010064 [Bathelium mastoideum]
MDPLSVTASAIAIAGAICTSYEQISKFVALVRNAPNQLEGLHSRAGTLNSLVANLKQALEENAIRKVVEQDELALSHVRALDTPLKAVEHTLNEVVDKLTSQYRPTTDKKAYKIRLKYYLSTSDWKDLQARLNLHVQVLSASMQGLNTLNVLRVLGAPSKDPARTLRTYAKSILEAPEGQKSDQPKPSPPPSLNNDPPSPLLLDERRRLAKKKLRLQRELLQAARSGDYLDASLLLSEGAETEWTEESEGMTALHFAARHGHLRVAEMLLEAGADIEAKNDAFGDEWVVRTEKGRTPLIWAAAGRDCQRKQERMCRLLLDKGADVNARNGTARTALQEAAMSARFRDTEPTATMELLLERGAHVNAYDASHWTALTECGLYGRKDMAELLLAHGAQVDSEPEKDDPSSDGNPDLEGKPYETPLVACGEWSWNEELICLLLDKGADIESKNKHGKTMAELASDAKRGVVLDKLDKIDKLQEFKVDEKNNEN